MFTRCGSSPRVWGTPESQDIPLFGSRFIPTRVGNSSFFWGNLSSTAVHPHACGELKKKSRNALLFIGSSPRVWGTLPQKLGVSLIMRFIPTRVGNSRSSGISLLNVSVHPHACGELWYWSRRRNICYGSSPRVWGTPFSPVDSSTFMRFIPTRVGNSNY